MSDCNHLWAQDNRCIYCPMTRLQFIRAGGRISKAPQRWPWASPVIDQEMTLDELRLLVGETGERGARFDSEGGFSA